MTQRELNWEIAYQTAIPFKLSTQWALALCDLLSLSKKDRNRFSM